MRQEKFKMERQGLINVGDEIEISEYHQPHRFHPIRFQRM